MSATATTSAEIRTRGDVPALLGGDVAVLWGRLATPAWWRLAGWVGIIILGSGAYGAAMGWWRSPIQAGYNAIKFPLVILATTAGNGLLNAMLAPLLGLNIRVGQSFSLVMMSFTTASLILGAFAPLIWFVEWNVPPMGPGVPWEVYNLVQLLHVLAIGFAGTAANTRLYRLLTLLAGSSVPARRVVVAWLAGNLFLGSQFCWIFRPFIGSPGLPVEFVRANALDGSFYETVLYAVLRLLNLTS
jgi:hypothetical protein